MKSFLEFLNESKVKFIINKDLSVDTLGDVYIGGLGLTKILVQFNDIKGTFSCADNKLTSLQYSPKTHRFIRSYFW